MLRAMISLLCVVLTTPAAVAQLDPAGGDQIDFRADYMEFFQDEQRLHCAINVRATQGGVRLLADMLDVHFHADADGVPGAIKSMTAQGSVAYITPTEVARADHGAYDAASGLMVLSGNVEVSGGPNVMTGERLAFHPQDNLSLAESVEGARLVIDRPTTTRAASAVQAVSE